MIKNYANVVAAELGVKVQQVNAVLSLLNEGGTVPFIARYRKEATGSLDEVVIAQIRDRNEQLLELDKRRQAIIKSIEEQGKMTPELLKKIEDGRNTIGVGRYLFALQTEKENQGIDGT